MLFRSAESRMNAIGAKTETSQSSQLDDETVIKKAMVTIAAKMDNPASAVFLDVNRAARKDAFGNSIDTICGRVRGKLAGDTGDRPFLYVVQKDEAYIGAYALISQYLQLRAEYRPWGLSRQRAARAAIAELTCAGTFRRRSTH